VVEEGERAEVERSEAERRMSLPISEKDEERLWREEVVRLWGGEMSPLDR
jgi:hypothetical protein